MIRAIFFDAVGTLLFPEPSAAAVYAQLAHAQGSRLQRRVPLARTKLKISRQRSRPSPLCPSRVPFRRPFMLT